MPIDYKPHIDLGCSDNRGLDNRGLDNRGPNKRGSTVKCILEITMT